jgi:hypothetical protein
LGLKLPYTCLDLNNIKLAGGSEGLEKFWDTWSHCVKRIMDNPPRTTCEHLFVDGMRQAPMLVTYVYDYDELIEGHPD